eukprot:TRINITY_DN10266_c0_g1_i2.p1 TRINITY_DN10266_c0_g1~~TRINITY_DN10266_c0_g1_i2.p1  ORF type:complete len:266 (+),score=21.23 TRINITY_DN10266_c0_g1_i2:340-1137(+)
MALFYTGGIVTRSAGCIVNDLVDRDIDSKVERTRTRPLASGELKPNQALWFLGAHVATGFGLLLTNVKWNAFLLSLGILPLAFTYPLAKRVTNYPQAILGLVFNYGCLIAYMNCTGFLDPSAFVVYGAGVVWTVLYDTIYAHQDKKDDALIGVKSTALTWIDRPHRVMHTLNAIVWAALTCGGYLQGFDWPYYALVSAMHLKQINDIHNWNDEDPGSSHRIFVNSRYFGFGITFALIVGRLWKNYHTKSPQSKEEPGKVLLDKNV